jgi:hypothetical protein
MHPSRSSEVLQAKIRIAAQPLHAVTESVWNHPALPDVFAEFLASIYDSVRVTIPLMEAARCTAVKLGERDPVAGKLAGYLEGHIAEEFEHDQWLLNDLAAVGFTREVMAKRLPRPSIAAMAGAQYYWIFHAHPVAILGYLAVLEGHAPSPAHLDGLQKRTGLPDEAFRMLRHHAAADEQHAADLFGFLDTLSLSDQHERLLGVSAVQTLAGIHDFFSDLAVASVLSPSGIEGRR